ncbi:MAG: hypothetical protein U0U67_07770 [Chitinophagales bacterium]
MQVEYSVIARQTIIDIAVFVERMNTKGSGNRWKNKFLKKIKRYAKPIKYALCRHEIYAANGFSCIAIDNWIIVFKTDNTKFNVYQIVLASNLY